jgi:four helix bundle suffix protein
MSANEAVLWVVEMYKRFNDGKNTMSTLSTKSTVSTKNYSEYSANAVLVLLAVACALLDRPVKALANSFEKEGGFTERLYQVRKEGFKKLLKN